MSALGQKRTCGNELFGLRKNAGSFPVVIDGENKNIGVVIEQWTTAGNISPLSDEHIAIASD
jgi:hypothetical protein